MQSKKKILFFDNEPYNLINMTPIADLIFIDEINPLQDPYETPTGNVYFSYTNFFFRQKNTYARILKRYNEGEHHMPTTGIIQPHIDVLEKWIDDKDKDQEHPNGVKNPLFAVFDWDRTIIATEGMWFLTEDECKLYKTSTDHIFEYAMGGRVRITLLQDMFRMLHDKGIHVFIVTNNPSADQVRDLFLETIRRFLYSDFIDNHLIYSGATGDKKNALEHNSDYQFIIAGSLLPPPPTRIPGGRSKKLYKKYFWKKRRIRKTRKKYAKYKMQNI
jgi:hypothetical protein